MAPYVAVATVRDIPPGTTKVVDADGQALAICNVDGAFYAVENRCSHDDGPLGEGQVIDHQLECPRHGARFDLRSGRPVTLPAVLPIKQFPVKVDGDRILVEV